MSSTNLSIALNLSISGSDLIHRTLSALFRIAVFQLSEYILSDKRSLRYLFLLPTYVVTESHVAGNIHTGRLLVPVNQSEISILSISQSEASILCQ